MASDVELNQNITKVYAAWVKSLLPSCSIVPEHLNEGLRDGQLLCQLIENTTGHQLELSNDEELDPQGTQTKNVQQVLDFLQSKGIDLKTVSAEDVVAGDLKAILDLLWLMILHFDVHSQSRAAYQRSVSMGKRFLLEWMATELPDVNVDTKGNFLESFQNGALISKVVCKHCEFENAERVEDLNTDEMQIVLDAAEEELDAPSYIISPPALLDGTVDEYSLLVYLTILRRKISEKKGEEIYRGAGSPVKQRAPQTPDKGSAVTPVKSPHTYTNGDIISPLSPTTLQNLVEQQAKSHEAIQSLQEKLQAVKYQPLTPKFQKKPFQRRPPKGTSPVKALTFSSPQESPSKMKPQATDCNANVLDTGVEDALNLSSKQIDQLYSSVDRRFLEFMLDAVHKGYLPTDIESSENWLNGNASVKDTEKGNVLEQDSMEAKPHNSMELQDRDSTGVRPDVDLNKSKDCTSAEAGINPKVVEASSEDDNHKSNDDTINTTTKDAETEPTTGDPEMSPKTSKKVHFLDQDTIISPQENSSDISQGELAPRASKEEDVTWGELVCSLPTNKQDDLNSTTTAGSVTNERENSVAQAAISFDSTSDHSALSDGQQETSQATSEVNEYFDDEEGVYSSDDICFDEDEENDQFMMYLNSIEQTALNFKLQVEQAKIETLQLLKERLELAYEGTPLEEIPSKVHEKLQETIAEIASEEVQKYENLLKVDDAFDEAESGIIQQMRKELDAVAQDNFRLQSELNSLKTYEIEYHELREKLQEMEDEMATMKHEYATKSGESDFLSERIETLEKEILDVRVEYEGQIRELQSENIDLQKECLELDNENRMLEEEVKTMSVGTPEGNDLDIYTQGNKQCMGDEVPVPACELEAFEIRLAELERHNKALRTAASADQAMVRCLENKISDLDRALIQAQDNNSKLLCEMHESQRQSSSDRAKLSSYKEEIDALHRENRVVKGTLQIAEGEVKYQREIGKRSPKGNRREIWNEIRELETILKDVHHEKRSIERKYLAFKHDSSDMSRSLNSSRSPTGSSPDTSTPPGTQGVSPGRTRTSSLLERVNSLLAKTSMPNGVTKELENVRPGSDSSVVTDSSLDYTMTPRSKSLPRNVGISSPESDVSRMETPREKASSLPRNTGSGLSLQLNSLRKHVGSLEAEKASILLELNHIKASPRTEIAAAES